MIEKKAYSWFLCVLLISVLLFPLRTTAGREILLQTEEGGSGNRGNDMNNLKVHRRLSNPAHSRTDHSSPSRAIPSRIPAANNKPFTDVSGSHGNDRKKMAVEPSHTKSALSRTDHSSPSHANPSRTPANNHVTGGNDGNKIPVHGSHSNPAHSRTDHSSPSRAIPSKIPANTVSKPNYVACGAGVNYRDCIKS